MSDPDLVKRIVHDTTQDQDLPYLVEDETVLADLQEVLDGLATSTD